MAAILDIIDTITNKTFAVSFLIKSSYMVQNIFITNHLQMFKGVFPYYIFII